MKVKLLSTGHQYDLACEDGERILKNLKNRIGVLNKQDDRTEQLSFIYEQVKQHAGYNGTDLGHRRAAKVYDFLVNKMPELQGELTGIFIVQARRRSYNLLNGSDFRKFKKRIASLKCDRDLEYLSTIYAQVIPYKEYRGNPAIQQRIADVYQRLENGIAELKADPSPMKPKIARKIVPIDEDSVSCSLTVPLVKGTVDGPLEQKWVKFQQRWQHLDPLQSPRKLIMESLALTKDYVQEHAARRVDLFFLLLVAVYKKNVVVVKGETTDQYGQGSRKLRGTQACHSSFFPALKMELPERQTRSAVEAVPSLAGTHLEIELNSTVELPAVVNGFDGYMEGRGPEGRSKLIRSCETILNQVAKGKLNPKSGMDSFLSKMNRFLNAPNANYFNREGKETPKEAKQLVHEYEKTGTFWAATVDRQHVRDEYMHMMLGVHKEEEQKQLKEKPELMEEYYLRKQAEIYSAPK